MPDNVVIVDYRLGNLYNVLRACEHVGLKARISSFPADVTSASAVILPGVGAFGDAMDFLRDSALDRALQTFAASGKPLLGICLGMQLLLSKSQEFGQHSGLGIVPGAVVRFPASRIKVPQVGWNQIWRPQAKDENGWRGTLLDPLTDGEYMYFVHSYYALPEDPAVVLATTLYGGTAFCSSLRRGNVTGCQFHPERSGPRGIEIYREFAEQAKQIAAPESVQSTAAATTR